MSMCPSMCGTKTKPTVIEPNSKAPTPRRRPSSSTSTSPRSIPATRSPRSTRNTESSETPRTTKSFKTGHTSLPSQTSQIPIPSTSTSPLSIPTTRSPRSTRNTESSETSWTTKSFKTGHTSLPSQTSQTPIPSEDPSTSENLKDSSKASTSTNVYTFSETCNATGFLDKRLSSSSSPYSSTWRCSISENVVIYDLSEICNATNNFVAKRFSSSSSSAWRCSIRGKDVIVFQRKFRRSIETSQLRERLSLICKSHHISLIKLLGASNSEEHIYLVYDYVDGTNLADCLRNPRNPSFTVLSTWISRMQIATDLAQGPEYIHHYTGWNLSLVHKHIKSSSLIVTQPSFNAKICHFGTAELCGEITITEISDDSSPSTSKLNRSDSQIKKFEEKKGYMSPEFQSTGIVTQKSDVFAFGVVILELLSGEEPLKYRIDKETKENKKISVIETAREAIESDEPGRIRRWVDRRLRDSFPVEVAEAMTRLALDCVHVDVEKRPDMRRVAGIMLRLFLESVIWESGMRVRTDFTMSLTAR